MTNYAHGHDAERVAADYLKKQGYKILALNWRRPRAEIDIIARKKYGLLTFFEVKYRQSNNQGGGFDYITPKKLTQMRFAAELWTSENSFSGEYTLGAIELSGANYEVTDVLESVI